LRNASVYADVYIQKNVEDPSLNDNKLPEYSGSIAYLTPSIVNDAYNKNIYKSDRFVTTSLLHYYDTVHRKPNAAGMDDRTIIGVAELNGPYLARHTEDFDLVSAGHIKDVYRNTYWYKPNTDAYGAKCRKTMTKMEGNTEVIYYIDCDTEISEKLTSELDSMSFTNDTAADLIETLKAQDSGWGSKEIDIRVNNYPAKLNIPWYHVDTSWVKEMQNRMDAWIAEMPVD
jgi:hypothetical protein